MTKQNQLDFEGIEQRPLKDFTEKAYIYDIIVAHGDVVDEFDLLGFDGGPNDGAVVVREDDPMAADYIAGLRASPQ